MALDFPRRGARIAIADINVAAAEEKASSVIAAGGKAAVFACDVTGEQSVRNAARDAEHRNVGIAALYLHPQVIVSCFCPGPVATL